MSAALRIRIDDNEDLEAARAAADLHAVELREMTPPPSDELEEHIEAVTAVLIGAGVVAGVKFVMDWWDRRQGGLVIDLRPEALDMFYRDRDLTFGYVVTIPVEGGQVTVDVRKIPDAAETWVTEVVKLGFKTVSDAAQAADTIVGAARVQVA